MFYVVRVDQVCIGSLLRALISCYGYFTTLHNNVLCKYIMAILPHCMRTLNGLSVCDYVCVNDIYTDFGAAAGPVLQRGSPSIFV